VFSTTPLVGLPRQCLFLTTQTPLTTYTVTHRTSKLRAKPLHHEIAIVGGGTAGLFTANRLRDAGISDIVVLEARPFVGGRVQTTRDGNDEVLFNNFAWRVGEKNARMIALAEELGIKLVRQHTPAESAHSNECKHGVHSDMGCEKARAMAMAMSKRELKSGRAPLSDFAVASLQGSASDADRQDRETGYAGKTSQVSWT